MPDTIIQFEASELPGGFVCPRTWQEVLAMVAQYMVGTIPGEYIPYVVSETIPDVEDQDKVWIKVSSVGDPVAMFKYSPTWGWVWPHPLDANTDPGAPPANNTGRIIIWGGLEADLWLHDGGDGTDPSGATPVSGSFWEVYLAFGDKFPLGVGATIPAVNTDADVFDVSTPAGPQGRSVYFCKRSKRQYYTP